jgi:UMF1 family MFS transporter
MRGMSIPVRRREIFGWAMFDFANSSYTTIVITVAFSVYFTKLVAGGGRADFLWGLGIWTTNVIVLLLSPVVGAIADGSGRKKAFLFASWATCVAGTAGLYWATPGDVALSLALLVVSFVAYSFGENFAGAFLPEISTSENVGRVSAFGWGIGYFGGLMSLLLVRPLLAGLDWEAERLLAPENAAVYRNLRLTWPVTAAFFLVAAIPTFALLRERARRVPLRGLVEATRMGLRRLRATAGHLAHFSELRRFLTVFLFYQAGLMAIVAYAGIVYQRTFGFTADELIGLFLALQLSSAAGAWIFGFVQDRLGGRRTIQMVLVLWILASVGAALATTKAQAWAIALAAGLGIGALQSASRAVVGLFSPAAKAGEFFGFWGMAAKTAYAMGALLFGAVSSATGSQRTAMLSLAVLFTIGLLGMFAIDEGRGRRAAEVWEREVRG